MRFYINELLAVIVVLAIIALVATPLILNVIEKSQKGAFQNSAYGIIEATELYYGQALITDEKMQAIFSFPNDTKLKYKGTKPQSGYVAINQDGKIEITFLMELVLHIQVALE